MRKGILFVVIFSLCLFCFSSCTERPDPQEHFKKYILDPIPKSVKNINVDETKIFCEYAYLFGFDINKEDLKLIIDSKSLTPAKLIDYTAGSFNLDYHYKDYEGMSIPVYGYNQKPASWFHLELWKNSDCYCYITEINNQNDRRILLFNKEENKAYFYIERSGD
jgi:hypothetical protein